jgi:hypothetical protein
VAFPLVAARATGRTTTTDTTTHAITLPAGIVAGNLLLVVFSVDGSPTISINTGVSGNNWNISTKVSYSTTVSSVYLWKIAEASNALTLTTSAVEQSSHVSFRITGAVHVFGASASGSSTNSNPPVDPAQWGTQDYLWIATRSGDSTIVATAAPANYLNLQTIAGAGTSGASTNTAERSINGSSEDPGTFTSLTEQWVAHTICVSPIRKGYLAGGTGAYKVVTDDLSAYTANSNLGGQGKWEVVTGNVRLNASKKVTPNASGADGCVKYNDGFSANHSSKLTVVTLDNANNAQTCCAVRISGYTYYELMFDNYGTYGVQLISNNNGSFTVLAQTTVMAVVGDVYELRAIGSTITTWKNGVLLDMGAGMGSATGSGGTYTDTTWQTGMPGISTWSISSESVGSWVGTDFTLTPTGATVSGVLRNKPQGRMAGSSSGSASLVLALSTTGRKYIKGYSGPTQIDENLILYSEELDHTAGGIWEYSGLTITNNQGNDYFGLPKLSLIEATSTSAYLRQGAGTSKINVIPGENYLFSFEKFGDWVGFSAKVTNEATGLLIYELPLIATDITRQFCDFTVPVGCNTIVCTIAFPNIGSIYIGKMSVFRAIFHSTVGPTAENNGYVKTTDTIGIGYPSYLSAILKAKGKFKGASTGAATTLANLKGRRKIAGSTTGVATETSVLKGKGKIVGSSTGVTTNAAILKGKGRIVGSSTGVTTDAAVFKAKGKISASSTGVTTDSASLRGRAMMIGLLGGIASDSAVLKGKGKLIAKAEGIAFLFATGQSKAKINGSALGISTNAAIFKATGRMIGDSTGAASFSAIANGVRKQYMKGSAEGSANAIVLGVRVLGMMKGTSEVQQEWMGVTGAYRSCDITVIM